MSGKTGRRELLLLTAVFLLAFVVYARTRAVAVGFVDSGEMILAAATLGILHPPGFPVWVPLAHLFTWLPFGSLAARVSLFSAAGGALAALLVVRIALRSGLPRESWLGGIAAASVGLTFAFSRTAWAHSVIAEVYALHTALLLAAIASALGWRRSGGGGAAVATGAFFGLALGVHHVTAILSLPILAALLLPAAGGRRGLDGVKLAIAGTLPALAAYFYLPWAATRDPLLSWGDLTRVEDLWFHVSGGRARQALRLEADSSWRLLEDFVSRSVVDFRPAALVLAGLGLFTLFRRDRRLLAGVILAALGGCVFTISFHVSNDRAAYLLPLFLGVAMALVHGSRALVDWADGRGGLAKLVVAAVLVVLPMDSFARHLPMNDRGLDRSAPAFVSNVFSGVPPGSLLLSFQPELSFPYLHERHLRGFRRDVDVVFARSLSLSWYRESYLPREGPGLFSGCEAELAAFREASSSSGSETAARETMASHRALLLALVRRRLDDGRAAYVDEPVPRFLRTAFTLVPVGLVYRIFADEPAGYVPAVPLDFEPWLDPRVSLEEVAHRRLLPVHTKMMAARAEYERRWNRSEAGARYDGLAERFERRRRPR